MRDIVKKGSMREALNNIHKVLREDEELLRLLYYPPADSFAGIPNPLSNSNDDITEKSLGGKDMGTELQFEVIGKSLLIGETNTEIEEEHICRIYLRLGKRRSKFGNYLLADQELTINVIVPNDYARADMRLEWIDDRLNELLTHEYISGMGKMVYARGDSRVAPHDYARYEHVYQFMVDKK